MKTKPTRAESLMRVRARRRICQVLETELNRDLLEVRTAWVAELVEQGVERRIIEAVAKDIAQNLRGIARSAKP